METEFNDNDGDMCQEEKELVDELEGVKERLDSVRQRMQNTSFFKMTEQVTELGRLKFHIRRRLQAHMAKVTALDWAADSQLLLTGAHDGKLIVWDTYSGNKLQMITSKSQWINGCSFAPGCRFICCGGFENCISIYDTQSSDQEKPCCVLPELEKYISCCKFLTDTQLINGSGDRNCTLWNIEKECIESTFKGHEDDIICLDIMKNSGNLFVSSSVDRTCRLWDIRIPDRFVRVFEGHEDDINGVYFFPEATYGFVSGSDDKACRLWDTRADQCIAIYHDDLITSGCTCVTLSRSGRLLLAGYDDYTCHVWDLLREERVGVLRAHDNRVSGVRTSPDGMAVATCSWDMSCLIWSGKNGKK